MMGHTHALSGATAFLAASSLLHLGSPAAVAVGAVCAAGAALLPDLDHPSASPARAFGPASWLLSRTVCWVSGGHRHATHSVIGLAGFTVAAWWANHTGGRPLVIALTFLAGLAARALLPRGRDRKWKLDWADIASTAHAVGAGWGAHLLVAAHMDLSVVPWAVGIGVAAHIAGDMLTPEGCPLWWPSLRYCRAAEIRTDSWQERWLVAGALYLILGVIAYRTWGSWSPTITHLIARS
jgi:membrane-bound metal-dependent hydrolase YbcI (DUF457 family)